MRLLICKDNEQNTLLETRVLQETDNVKYEIIENAPMIENKEGYTGKYILDSDGNVIVEYTKIEPTEVELLEQRIAEMQELLAEMAMNGMGE